MKRAIDLSRAEAEFRRGVEQRGGAYERGGGSGSTRGNVMQRMFRRSTSQRKVLWWRTITWQLVGEEE